MKNNFNDCVNRVLESEGGYTNDPSDSGGPTNFGITIVDYRKYVNKRGVALDVRNMSKAQAINIYKSKYWDALNCDNLSGGVDYTCFDYGVNSGIGRPQKALGEFKSLSGTKLIDAINDERTAFLKALAVSRPKDKKFLNGWLSRVSRVRAYSKELAKNNVAGPSAGAATVGIGAAISQYFHNHEVYVIIAAVIIAVAVGTAVHLYKNRK